MSQFWEQQLGEIREQLLMMSGLAERNLSVAMRAFVERDDKLCDTVEAEDTQIDQLEIHIDELVITYMATHGPIARDCRLMLAASKIASNLERIGDQATTIARRARELNREPLLRPMVDVSTMAEIASEMLRDSITAFVEANADLAVEIIARDRSVNDLNRTVAKELTAEMISNPRTITRALNVVTIAKALERVADHATNVAEEVHYLYKGEDIRHEPTLHHPAGSSSPDRPQA
ncbi:MAG TPA: phosphate signaling complex protein PhoU [Chthoniobacteraceae bacterium]|jgi:phosphate transport system protein|nr:phosphate signaling complex protein PhoU [Chthoniobacteraceae bacterium]